MYPTSVRSAPEVRCGLPLLSKLIALFGLEMPEISDVEEFFVGSSSLTPNRLGISVRFAVIPGADLQELEPRLKRHIANQLYEYSGARFEAFKIDLVQSVWPTARHFIVNEYTHHDASKNYESERQVSFSTIRSEWKCVMVIPFRTSLRMSQDTFAMRSIRTSILRRSI